MYTRSTTVAEAAADRKWFIVDLAGETVGRAATNGTHSPWQHKPTYTPHIDDGDFIIAINAEGCVHWRSGPTRPTTGTDMVAA